MKAPTLRTRFSIYKKNEPVWQDSAESWAPGMATSTMVPLSFLLIRWRHNALSSGVIRSLRFQQIRATVEAALTVAL